MLIHIQYNHLSFVFTISFKNFLNFPHTYVPYYLHHLYHISLHFTSEFTSFTSHITSPRALHLHHLTSPRQVVRVCVRRAASAAHRRGHQRAVPTSRPRRGGGGGGGQTDDALSRWCVLVVRLLDVLLSVFSEHLVGVILWIYER